MKTYLAKFTIHDGEHEHSNEFLLEAENDTQADELAKAQQHEPEYPNDDEHMTYWDYGDGTTRAELDSVQEVTKEEANIIHRLSLAYYL